jgi:hypothetical protein
MFGEKWSKKHKCTASCISLFSNNKTALCPGHEIAFSVYGKVKLNDLLFFNDLELSA